MDGNGKTRTPGWISATVPQDDCPVFDTDQTTRGICYQTVDKILRQSPKPYKAFEHRARISTYPVTFHAERPMNKPSICGQAMSSAQFSRFTEPP